MSRASATLFVIRPVVFTVGSCSTAGAGNHVFLRSPVAEIDEPAALAAKRKFGIVQFDFFLADRALHVMSDRLRTALVGIC